MHKGFKGRFKCTPLIFELSIDDAGFSFDDAAAWFDIGVFLQRKTLEFFKDVFDFRLVFSN